jgi:hypothetical protein
VVAVVVAVVIERRGWRCWRAGEEERDEV